MHRPSPSEYAPYFEKYIALVPEEDILSALEMQRGNDHRPTRCSRMTANVGLDVGTKR